MQARKIVTVLFADITGSTALGERLDPETVREVMARYFDQSRVVIERHGGTVEKFIGDAVMAVFGVPIAHEDDALRAVRAAAELQTALANLNGGSAPEQSLRLQARIGVNTGEVVVGDPSSGASFVTGDPVNVAARLEQEAQPGEILIGEQTYQLVRDAVTVRSAGALSLKGKADPVVAHRLIDVRAGAKPHARRLESPLVGRDQELARLLGSFETVAAEPTCRRITVVGEAGVGKSRLVGELIGTIADRARTLFGRCLPYGEGITYWPIGEAVRSAAGIAQGDPPERARARIASCLSGSDDAPLVVDRMAAILGLSETGAEIHETFWAVRRFLESLTREGPVLLVIEDVHWAEPTLLDLIDYLVEFGSNWPILILATARSELRETRPEWVIGESAVVLRPLSTGDSDLLIDNLVGRLKLSPDVRLHLIETADGNPLFLEEFIRMLIDDQLLVRDDGHWVSRVDLSYVAVPSSIHALLSARLDRLTREERSVVQCAAVIGKEFSWGAVTHLAPSGIGPRVGDHLQALLRKELVRPERPGAAGEDAFRFGHILIRDAAYGTIPKRARADMHERFAEWVEDRAAERVAEYEEIVGYHLEQAHLYGEELDGANDRTAELGHRAAVRLESAGRRALARGDVRAAVNLLGRAVDLSPDEWARVALLPDLGSALIHAGELDRAGIVLTEAVRLAANFGDRGTEALARTHLVDLRLSTDPSFSIEEAQQEGERAIRVFEELGDDWGLSSAWQLVAQAHNAAGRWDQMAAAAARAIEHARRAKDVRGLAISSGTLAMALYQGPTPIPEAIEQLTHLLEASSSPAVRASVEVNLGRFLGGVGRFDEARELIARAKRTWDDLGDRLGIAAAFGALSAVEYRAGEWAAEERASREGYDILLRMGEKSRLSTEAGILANALYELGRDAEALTMSDVCRETMVGSDLASEMWWRCVRAKVLARRGESSEAERLGQEAIRLVEDRGDLLFFRPYAYEMMADVLVLLGRPQEAVPLLEQALKLRERKGDLPLAERDRRRLAELLEKSKEDFSLREPPAAGGGASHNTPIS